MTFEQMSAVATVLGTLVSIIVAIAAFSRSRQVDAERFGKLELMVVTLWNLYFQKAGSNMVGLGSATLQSPLEINAKTLGWFCCLKKDLQDFYRDKFKAGSDADLAIAIHQNFSVRIIKEVSIPSGIDLDQCLIIAAAVAKDGSRFELPGVPVDSSTCNNPGKPLPTDKSNA